MIQLQLGKINVLIDGQLGSCGKGLVAEYIGLNNHIDVSVTSAASNAGHSFIYHGKKYISKYIPVSAIVNKRNTIYLSAGCIINPAIFEKEMEQFDIDPCRVIIHPRCAVITDQDIINEKNPLAATTKLSSTQSGVGAALARKILREAVLADKHPYLSRYVNGVDLHYLMDCGCTVFMEVPQGMDLGLSNGFEYPFCTSRDISVSAALSDAQVHPSYLGKVCSVIRTYPIRVGNIKDEDGNEIGNSGSFYPDSKETTWEAVGVPEEITTVTGRVRRVFEFSFIQYSKMLDTLRPDFIVLNFANYMSDESLSNLLNRLPEITHLGFGPKAEDIVER